MSEKPLLLIDVDGPLNPWAKSNSQSRKDKRFTRHKLLGFTVWLSEWHGEELMKLTDVYDLVWATTWEHDANALIAPRVGVPELPVIEFARDLPSVPPVPGLHWKVAAILKYCAGRPFVWVDDEVGAVDGVYAGQHHGAPFLMLRIDPTTGLTEEHFDSLREWAEGEAV